MRVRTGRVAAIFIGPEAEGPMKPVDEVRAIAGRGLEGDRYFIGSGTYSDKPSPGREVTLFESEAIDAVNAETDIPLDGSETRRNIMTREIALNHLVGKEFRVGEVRLRGIKLCEPCKHLEAVTGKKIELPLLHRGGLRAQVVSDGVVRVGDTIEEIA
jgi:MOSC domain-containing protein YiiM